MACTKKFLNLEWEHHHWRPRVTSFEILELEEPDMWARPVYRQYMRCDKQQVCDSCGTVRREVSCSCDMTRAQRCPVLAAWLAESGQTIR
jgi:hypothetical protein